jgi:hypothetical protein
MINTIFDACVQLLLLWASWFGITYKAINVWIFVIIWPILTLIMVGIIIWQYLKIRKLTNQAKLKTPSNA